MRSQETYQLSSLLLQYKGLNFGTCRCKSRALDIQCFSCSVPFCLQFCITLSQADESSSVSLERDYEPVFIHQFQVPWDTAKVSGGHGSMSVKVFLAICCSFFCSVAVSVRADLPEYCGPQNYAYTPLRKDPRGEFTVKQVHVVIRFVASDVQNNMCYVNFYSS